MGLASALKSTTNGDGRVTMAVTMAEVTLPQPRNGKVSDRLALAKLQFPPVKMAEMTLPLPLNATANGNYQ